MKVTIMGLGLHGGGLASTLFFASRGADVTVTDLRSEEILAPVMEKLRNYPVSYVLGEHRIEDFENADIVVKNPAVPVSSPYLKAAKRIETDISVFLSLNRRPVIAVTGSKGKSTTVSAIYHVLRQRHEDTKLGGNITVSPLSFIDSCLEKSGIPVILELSSWQLADLKGKNLLKPKTALITNIMPDHQNRYASMEEYVSDKKLIYRDMDGEDTLICNYDDKYGHIFASETEARVLFISGKKLPDGTEGLFMHEGKGFIRSGGKQDEILPEYTVLKGKHNKLNLLMAAAVLKEEGLENRWIGSKLAAFQGIPHRMEEVAVIDGVTWYNDSAATIPQATAAAVESMDKPSRLICGGTDKEISFDGFAEAMKRPEMIYLLEGSATDRMIPILKKNGIPFKGLYNNLDDAVKEAAGDSKPGEAVIFSPGATSFGMFLNEFDRGNKFKKILEEMQNKGETS